ncbi:MAG: N-acetylglucosamine repressor [Candidatus Ordinivivax streblomastigis]|uniref:N-acetylglucosamine repressor n=1 Tax=Candidatus Ordinivivax streblomastigis TaxID=2540710 RepID=A0A5M8NZA8_9BACT|nr:MAG: N-acetylglucosamine repressor [Candidatus Ordinivivax streblomastigis]
MILTESEKKVLSTVRKKGNIAIADVVEDCGLSTATGSRLINKLISKKFLIETEPEPNSGNLEKGRPQRHVRWHCPDYYAIGIDVGTTHIKGAIFNLNLDFVKEVDMEMIYENEMSQVFARINEMIERLLDTNLIDKKRILGIGVAFAGLVNKKDKIIKFSPAFNWHHVNAAQYIVNKTKLPLFYDNVTRLMALSEIYFGHGKSLDNFIFVNIGFGIGASIVIDGNLFTGQNGYAGEFGHVIAEPDSPIQCPCGQYGCLTTTSSGEYIAKRFISRLQNGDDSILKEDDLLKIDTKMIFDAARNQDALSVSVIDDAIRNLAIRLSDLKKCFDPQAIIIGGGVSINEDYFFSALEEKMTYFNKMKYSNGNKLHILPRSFPGKAASIGAGMMVAQKVINL